MSAPIPLSVPNIAGNEWKYIKECLDTGWVSTAGPFVKRFENEFGNYVKSKYAVACSSGSAALHIALKVAGVRSGDLVLAPSLTFIASINAIHYAGADPYFFDSDEFYNVDSQAILDFLENECSEKSGEIFHRKTKKRIAAALVVHTFGNAANLFSLAKYCRSKNLPLIEDAAESVGTFYNSQSPEEFRDKHTGTIGTIGCFSFNGNKIMTTGGGGMIVTDSEKFAERAKYYTTQSKDDELYFIHDEIGFNYRMTNIQAAMGSAQLEMLPKFLEKKRSIFNFYKENIPEELGLKIAITPSYASNNHWLNCLQINEEIFGESRDQLLHRLIKSRIEARPVWQLNHLQKPYMRSEKSNIETAIKLWKCTLNLPSSTNLETNELEYVVRTLREK